MQMPDFIENNLESILQEWERFAGTLRPAAEGMTQSELRNLAETTLRAVADDMRSEESEEERHRRATGQAGAHEHGQDDVVGSAKAHAAERLAAGFTLNQLIAEYRALRASVIRQWRASVEQVGEDELEELIRFDEAIDESLTEAVGWYNARIEDARDLLNGVLAHDLRSPLSAILAIVEVFMRDEALDPRYTQMASRARNSGNRMKAMISDLLDFTRTRLGTGLPMYPEDDDMGEILRDEIEEMRIFNPGAEIRFEASGDLKGCWDRARIERSVSNLIGNAVGHGREGSTITVSAEEEDDRVIVKIHNEGGIPEEEQKLIFDPLRRAAVRGGGRPKGAGVGLGLYIARQIVEAHDGTVDVHSSEEQGTTFTMRLPRQRRPGAESAGLS